jgi:hypothetical protein
VAVEFWGTDESIKKASFSLKFLNYVCGRKLYEVLNNEENAQKIFARHDSSRSAESSQQLHRERMDALPSC